MKQKNPQSQGKGALNKDEEIVLRRWQNDRFEWTPENTQKIISVIQALDKKVNEMYDAVVKTKKFLESDVIPNNRAKEDYSIEATMTYERYDEAIPSADANMLTHLYDATNWKIMPAVCASDGRMESREQQLYLGLNWNIELFDRPELTDIKIPYYVHVLFVDSCAYTLNDMIHMNPDDFCIGIEVRFDGEKIL